MSNPCRVTCWAVLVTACAEYVRNHPESLEVVERAFMHLCKGDPRDVEIAAKNPWPVEHVLQVQCDKHRGRYQ